MSQRKDFGVTVNLSLKASAGLLSEQSLFEKVKQLAQCQEEFLSHTQDHLKLKEEFSKLGKKFCFHCSKGLRLSFGNACYFVLFSSSDDELKGVREKNRQNETIHERLSSDKVSGGKKLYPKFWCWLLTCFWELFDYDIVTVECFQIPISHFMICCGPGW